MRHLDRNNCQKSKEYLVFQQSSSFLRKSFAGEELQALRFIQGMAQDAQRWFFGRSKWQVGSNNKESAGAKDNGSGKSSNSQTQNSRKVLQEIPMPNNQWRIFLRVKFLSVATVTSTKAVAQNERGYVLLSSDRIKCQSILAATRKREERISRKGGNVEYFLEIVIAPPVKCFQACSFARVQGSWQDQSQLYVCNTDE